jgi:hypothetical protein
MSRSAVRLLTNPKRTEKIMANAGITVKLTNGTIREFKTVELPGEIKAPKLYIEGMFAIVIEPRFGKRTTFPATAILEIIEQS